MNLLFWEYICYYLMNGEQTKDPDSRDAKCIMWCSACRTTGTHTVHKQDRSPRMRKSVSEVTHTVFLNVPWVKTESPLKCHDQRHLELCKDNGNTKQATKHNCNHCRRINDRCSRVGSVEWHIWIRGLCRLSVSSTRSSTSTGEVGTVRLITKSSAT
jgi:hypothetical protein